MLILRFMFFQPKSLGTIWKPRGGHVFFCFSGEKTLNLYLASYLSLLLLLLLGPLWGTFLFTFLFTFIIIIIIIIIIMMMIFPKKKKFWHRIAGVISNSSRVGRPPNSDENTYFGPFKVFTSPPLGPLSTPFGAPYYPPLGPLLPPFGALS